MYGDTNVSVADNTFALTVDADSSAISNISFTLKDDANDADSMLENGDDKAVTLGLTVSSTTDDRTLTAIIEGVTISKDSVHGYMVNAGDSTLSAKATKTSGQVVSTTDVVVGSGVVTSDYNVTTLNVDTLLDNLAGTSVANVKSQFDKDGSYSLSLYISGVDGLTGFTQTTAPTFGADSFAGTVYGITGTLTVGAGSTEEPSGGDEEPTVTLASNMFAGYTYAISEDGELMTTISFDSNGSYTAVDTDGDGEPYTGTWTIADNILSGTDQFGTIDLVFTTEPSTSGSFTLDWEDNAQNGGESGSDSVTYTRSQTQVAPANNAPTIAAIADVNGTVGTAITSITLQGSDADTSDTLTYSTTTLPGGLTLSGATISGTPTTEGNTTVTATVSDGTDTASTDFVISISAAAAEPELCQDPFGNEIPGAYVGTDC
jgi:hypothetical protein